jgi:hypothetical protein
MKGNTSSGSTIKNLRRLIKAESRVVFISLILLLINR